MIAQISAVIFGLLAAVSCRAAFRQRRIIQTMVRRDAESAKALAARDTEHNERISRLEHDLKSPLGAILGFSTLLRELVHENLQEAPPAVLRSVNGIDQAARKMLQIIEAASKTAGEAAGKASGKAAGARNSRADRQEVVIERNR